VTCQICRKQVNVKDAILLGDKWCCAGHPGVERKAEREKVEKAKTESVKSG